MEQREVTDHGVERIVGQREFLSVGDPEIKARMKSGGKRDHFVGNVDRNDRRSSFGGPGGDIAGSRRYVEELDTAAYGDRIEQWFDEAAGDLTEEAVVSGCLGVPARRLKRRERV
jgi:hypothetical protein